MKNERPSLKINTIFNAIYQILALLVPLITTPYVSRTLGVDAIGQYSYFYSIITYFTLIATFGFNDYGTKKIAESRDDKKQKTIAFLSIFVSKFFFGLFCLLIYLIFSFCFFKSNNIFFVISFAIYIISTMIDPVFYFQGEEKFISICFKNITLKALSTILIFLLVRTPDDLITYTLILAGSQLFSTISLFFSLRKNNFTRISLKDLQFKKTIYSSFPFFIPALAISLFTYLNQTLLGILVNDDAESGYYGQAIKVINILATLAASLSIIMLSRISYLKKIGNEQEINRKIKQTFEAFWVLSLPLCFGLISINSIFTPLFFGQSYEKCITLIYILAPTIIFSPLNGLYGNLYYRPNNKIWIQTIAIFVSSLLNIILSFLLMPSLMSYGACVSKLVAEIIQLPILLFFSKKVIKPLTILKTLLKPLISSLLMTFLLFFIKYFLTSNQISSTYSLLILIPSGIIIYFSFEFLFKDEIIIENTKRVFAKIKSFFVKR